MSYTASPSYKALQEAFTSMKKDENTIVEKEEFDPKKIKDRNANKDVFDGNTDPKTRDEVISAIKDVIASHEGCETCKNALSVIYFLVMKMYDGEKTEVSKEVLQKVESFLDYVRTQDDYVKVQPQTV